MEKQKLTVSLQAGQFDFGVLEHPNKLPFEGLMTWLDLASDKFVGGAGGKKVVIPSQYGIPALATLQGMAVNFDSIWMDKHVSTNKIGVIEEAWAGEAQEHGGIPVYVKGFVYAHDFPEEAAQIKEEQQDLGFSYETIDTPVVVADFGGEQVLMVCDDFVFSGAAILLAQKAAYTNTSLAASADEEEETTLEIKKIVEAVMAAMEAKYNLSAKGEEPVVEEEKIEEPVVEEKVEDKTEEKVEDSTEQKTEEKVEDKDLNAGADETVDFKAQAEDFKAQLEAANAKIAQIQADLKAEADAKEANTHKGFEFPTTLVAKYNLDAAADTYESKIAAVDARNDLSTEEKMALKFELRSENLKTISK